MVRFLSVAIVLVAFVVAVSPDWAQEAKPAPQKDAGVDLEALFKKLDVNGDGKIDLEEFKKLPELYKPTPAAKGKGKLDPAQIQKILDQVGGQGNIDPEQLRKLLEKAGTKGGLKERLEKLKDKLGKNGVQLEFNGELIKGIIDQIGGQGGEFDPAQIQDLIQGLIGALGKEKKLQEKNDK